MGENCLVAAHRGASLDAPENTIPAIEKAVADGADAVVLEVQPSKDDEPFVVADPRVDRTTDGTGRVRRLSAAELKALDAGSWFGEAYAEVRIPTLPEALAAFGSDTRLLLVVPDLSREPKFAARLAEVLAERRKPEDDVLLFGDSPSLTMFREQAPQFGCALILDGRVGGKLLLEKAEKFGLQVVRPLRAQVDSDFAAEVHRRGLKIYVHFADAEEEWAPLLNYRVDGIITHRPKLLREALRGRNAGSGS